MVIQLDRFQDSCKKILGAVDTDSALKNVLYGYDALELEADGSILNLNVTNGEYYVSIGIPIDEDAHLRAVVDARLFLALISKITTKAVQIDVEGEALVVKANGTYKFPMKFDVDKLVELPKIPVGDVVTDFPMDASNLVGILNNNTRILADDKSNRPPLEKLYYMDQEGCITFTRSNCCVLSFTLPKPVKVLLTQKLVGLSKLLSDGEVIATLGSVDVGGSAQFRLNLRQGDLSITSILPSDPSLIGTIPVSIIRGKVNNVYPCSATFDRTYFLEALDRALLFDNKNSVNSGVGVFEFGEEGVSISSVGGAVAEEVGYMSSSISTDYRANLNIISLREILTTATADTFTMKFGDKRAVVIICGSVKNAMGEAIL